MMDAGNNHIPSHGPRLRLLCVGAARDGSQSITRMFRETFEHEGGGRQVMHEYASREFGDRFANYMETNDPAYLRELRRLIAECPFDCVVGTGYAPVLPLFREICGPDLAVIHVRRLDREAAIDSLMDNCAYFPAAYKHYSSSPDAVAKRMAAFHFGEMSPEGWDALPLRAKLAWYFDKTHALIDADAGGFELNTEELNQEPARRIIARLALGNEDWLPAPTHLNAHVHMAETPPERRAKMQWLMGQFDLMRAAEDDVYPIEYFLNAFVAWTGYQLRRAEQIGPEDYRTDAELERTLTRAAQVLDESRSLIEALKTAQAAQAAATIFDLAGARDGLEAFLPATIENARHSLRRHGLAIIRSGIDPIRIAGLVANARLYGERVESAARAGAVPTFGPSHSYSPHMLAANLAALDPDTADTGNDFPRTSFCKALLTDLVKPLLQELLGPNPAWVSARVRAIIPNHDGPNGRIRLHTENSVVPYDFPGLHNIWSPLVPEGIVANRDVAGLQFLLGDEVFFTDIGREEAARRLAEIAARVGSGIADPESGGFFYRPRMRLGDIAIFTGCLPHGTFVPDTATAMRVGADLRVCPMPELDSATLEKLAPSHRPAPLDGC